MKYKYVFIFVVFKIVTIIQLSGQLNIDGDNQTDGEHKYYDDGIITAPSGTIEIDYSESAKVKYKSADKVCLKPGFKAGNFDDEGYFKAEIGQGIFDDFSFDPADEKVAKYEKFEITINLAHTFSNPYDPDEIDLYAVFTSPSGITYNIPGFYYEEINSTNITVPDYINEPFDVEYLESTGNFCWKIRFTPNETYNWTYKIYAQTPGRLEVYPQSGSKSFNCEGGDDNKGFIRRRDTRYFEYDNGDLYFPIGINIARSSHVTVPSDWRKVTYGTYEYEEKFDEFENNGLNFVRIFQAAFFNYLYGYYYDKDESIPESDRHHIHFHNNLNQRHAARLDNIIDYAGSKNIAVQMCLFAAGDLADNILGGRWSGHFFDATFGQSYGEWHNPFNASHGGLLEKPEDFFDLDEQADAKKIQKDFIRYIIARWGYSTNIFAWELFNEVLQINKGYYYANPSDPDNKDSIVKHENILQINEEDGADWDEDDLINIQDWHLEMTSYIRDIDQFDHLITTSYGELEKKRYNDSGIVIQIIPVPKQYYEDAFNTMDVVQSHLYENLIPNLKDSHNNNTDWNFQDVLYSRIQTVLDEFSTKPYLVGEYGTYKTNLIKYGDNNQFIKSFDPWGYETHNNMWLSVFSGSSGLPADWYHNYVDDRFFKEKFDTSGYASYPLYFNYMPIRAFVETYPIFCDDFTPGMEYNENGLRICDLKNDNENIIMGWVQDTNFTSKELFTDFNEPKNNTYIYSLDPDERPGVSNPNNAITLSVPENGDYYTIWNWTNTNNIFCYEEESTSDNNEIVIHIPQALRESTYGDAAFYTYYDSGTKSTKKQDAEENNNYKNGKHLLLYPNPANNAIKLYNIHGNIKIYDIYGKEYYSIAKCENDRVEINTSNWPEGVYIIKEYDNDSLSETFELIIIH